MKEKLIQIWCWIMGHDTICLKRYSQVREGSWLHTTTSAFKCLRCKKQWDEQWDE